MGYSRWEACLLGTIFVGGDPPEVVSLGALDFEQRHGVRCREPENPFELFKALPVDSIIQALERLLLRQSVIVVGNEEPTSYTQLFNAMETYRALLYPTLTFGVLIWISFDVL